MAEKDHKQESKMKIQDLTSPSAFKNVDINKISPADFVNYLPWACMQLCPLVELAIEINTLDVYSSILPSSKKHLKKDGKHGHESPQPFHTTNHMPADEKVKHLNLVTESNSVINENIIRVCAVYSAESLVQLKFLNNKHVPRSLLKIVGLATEFHVMLTSITINRGLDEYTVYELSKILHKSNINDLNFDDAFCREGNFDMLLESPSKLKSLSLARCKIEDPIVVKLAARLVYTAPGSKTLSILNLSSNRITNVGARALSDALRSNRSLNYLNLANNWIDDDGAMSIIKVLQPFLLTGDEVIATKSRKLVYLRKFNRVVLKRVKWLKSEDPNSAEKVKKKLKPVTRKIKSLTDVNLKLFTSTMAQEDNEVVYSEAKNYARIHIGEFDDPFDKSTTVGGLIYCNGNYSLAYLNLAYNNLSYLILGPIADLLDKQSTYLNKTTNGGLLSVVLEGNPLPANCKESKEIEHFIGLKISNALDHRSSGFKKLSTVKKPIK